MRSLVIIAVLALVSTGCGSGGVGSGASSPADGSESAAASPFVSVPFDELGANHIEPPVSFSHSPSIGGDHYPFWQNCGVYSVPVIEGAATHTLEHGAVWVTYNPDVATAADVDTLDTLGAENPRLLISPYPHAERLVLTAWGVQQRLDVAADAPEVGEFIDTWLDNPVLPEAGVSCVGAVGLPPDDPASWPDGGEVPEEYR